MVRLAGLLGGPGLHHRRAFSASAGAAGTNRVSGAFAPDRLPGDGAGRGRPRDAAFGGAAEPERRRGDGVRARIGARGAGGLQGDARGGVARRSGALCDERSAVDPAGGLQAGGHRSGAKGRAGFHLQRGGAQARRAHAGPSD